MSDSEFQSIVLFLLAAGLIAAARLGFRLGVRAGKHKERESRKTTFETLGIGHKKDETLCYSFETDPDDSQVGDLTPCFLCGIPAGKHLTISRGFTRGIRKEERP